MTGSFTAAQKGSMPVPIMKRYKEGLDQVARDPHPVYLEPSEETRKKIAGCYGANTDEIAISRNTTDAVAMILSGMDWKSGDELLTSTMEYPNCVATMLRVATRFGITIREFGVPMHPSATAEEVIESAHRQIQPRQDESHLLFRYHPVQRPDDPSPQDGQTGSAVWLDHRS